MNGNSGFRVLAVALLAVAVAAMIAIGAYNAGVQHGIVTSGKVVVAPGAMPPYAYGWGWHPWGPSPIFAIVAFVAVFAVLRAALWRGHWHHHHHHACCAPVRQDENDSRRG